MNSLSQIETAIAQLSEAEARTLLNWLHNYLDEAWDSQIEADVRAGRLDQIIQRAQADITANRVLSCISVQLC